MIRCARPRRGERVVRPEYRPPPRSPPTGRGQRRGDRPGSMPSARRTSPARHRAGQGDLRPVLPARQPPPAGPHPEPAPASQLLRQPARCAGEPGVGRHPDRQPSRDRRAADIVPRSPTCSCASKGRPGPCAAASSRSGPHLSIRTNTRLRRSLMHRLIGRRGKGGGHGRGRDRPQQDSGGGGTPEAAAQHRRPAGQGAREESGEARQDRAAEAREPSPPGPLSHTHSRPPGRGDTREQSAAAPTGSRSHTS